MQSQGACELRVTVVYNTRYLPLFGPNRKNRFTRLAKMARARSLAAILLISPGKPHRQQPQFNGHLKPFLLGGNRRGRSDARARPLEVARPTVSRRRKGRAPQRTAARIIEDDHNLRARTAELNAAAFAFARARGIFWTRIFVGKGQIWS